MSPSHRKKLGFENSFYTSEIGRYFLGFFSLHELRLFCMNWGYFAQIEVVLHRLRLPCTDWGCPAQIEVAPHRLRLPCTNFDRIWIDEAFLLWKKELWPWGLYVEAFLRGSEARRSSWNLDQYKVYIYRVKEFWSDEMANFRVCNGLLMTDTWLNQGGDASMATVASREVSTMPDTPTYSPPHTRSFPQIFLLTVWPAGDFGLGSHLLNLIFIILIGERTRRSGVGEKSKATNPRKDDNFKWVKSKLQKEIF